jgi:hypothetical protein
VNVVGVVLVGSLGCLLIAFDVEEKLGCSRERLGGGWSCVGWRCRLLCGDGSAGDAEEECEAALAHAEG